MKKLIASAASLTLAATILAGSASAASPLDFLKEFSWKNLFCQSQQAEQSQTEKALALINTFATGDTKTARSLLADHRRPVHLAESERQVLMVTGR